jgi:hypothetical protein
VPLEQVCRHAMAVIETMHIDAGQLAHTFVRISVDRFYIKKSQSKIYFISLQHFFCPAFFANVEGS